MSHHPWSSMAAATTATVANPHSSVGSVVDARHDPSTAAPVGLDAAGARDDTNANMEKSHPEGSGSLIPTGSKRVRTAQHGRRTSGQLVLLSDLAQSPPASFVATRTTATASGAQVSSPSLSSSPLGSPSSSSDQDSSLLRAARASSSTTTGIARTTKPPNLSLLPSSVTDLDFDFFDSPVVPLELSPVLSISRPSAEHIAIPPAYDVALESPFAEAPASPPIPIERSSRSYSFTSSSAYSNALTSTTVSDAPPVRLTPLDRSLSSGTFGSSNRSRATHVAVDSGPDDSPRLPGAHLSRQTSIASTALTVASSGVSATHWRPETDVAIIQHLLAARQRSDSAIVPPSPTGTLAPSPSTLAAFPEPPTREPSPPAQASTSRGEPVPAPHKPPPSAGTPLICGGVDEQPEDSASVVRQNSRVARAQVAASATTPYPSREDDTLRSAHWTNRHVDMYHHQSESSRVHPALTLDETERLVKRFYDEPLNLGPDPSHIDSSEAVYRTMSIESGDSGYAESTTTLANLLPSTSSAASAASHNAPYSRQQPTVPNQVYGSLMERLPAAMASKSDLTADQKAQLVKRTRKLERMLGEQLTEPTIERFVVEPVTATTTVTTKVEEDVWPSSNSSAPEWLREDCVPQRVVDHGPSDPKSSQRKGGRLARAIRGEAAMPVTAGLRVYVARETTVAETLVRGEQQLVRGEQHHQINLIVAPPSSPGATTSTDASSPPSSPTRSAEDAARTARRLQLAKLKRLLGTPIPSHLVDPLMRNSEEDLVPSCTPPLRETSQTNLQVLGDKLRSRAPFRRNREGKEVVVVDTVSQPPPDELLDPNGPMSASDRQLARMRATRLEKKFGITPPPALYLPIQRPQPLGPQPTGSRGSPTFDGYRNSLQSLIYLVEHDQDRLACLVDELESANDDEEEVMASLAPPANSPYSPASPASVYSTKTPTTVRRLSGRTSPAASTATGSSFATRFTRRMSAPPASVSFSPFADDRSPSSPRSFFVAPRGNTTPPPSISAATCPSPHASTTSLATTNASPSFHRRRNSSKLSKFFGDDSIDFAALQAACAVPPSASTLPMHSVSERAASPLSVSPASTMSTMSRKLRPFPHDVSRPTTPPAARRRDTLDGVLLEMWHAVQGEVSRGALGAADAARLGDLMGLLRRKREHTSWAEL